MSLSISLGNAITGLSAAARGAEIVSSNVANATTEGYGVRRLELSARGSGQGGAGVEVVGVNRIVDMHILGDRRLADAQSAFGGVQLSFMGKVEDLIGLPGDIGSLPDRLAEFDAALISATARPDIDARLSSAVTAARQLADAFNAISDGIQGLRQDADTAIATDVALLNTTLQQIQDLNEDITRRLTAGQDYTAQIDNRQVLIDRVSEIVPVKEIERGRGQIALLSPGGGLLLDGKPATFEFSPVGVITPDMNRAAGSLSGLTMNGIPVNLDADVNPIAGGRLAAHFAVRDELAVTEQARLDALARDLVERFQDPALDTTLLAGDAGLFTDQGAAFVPLPPAFEEGLSARLQINAAVDPEAGGEVWRLRDGMNAVAPGEVGNGQLLQALTDVLQDPRAIGVPGYSGALRGAAGLTLEFLSLVGTQKQVLEGEVTYAEATQASLREIELRGGVDTDFEMQQLLLVETAYNANARVIQTVDELLARLMEI